MVKKEQGFPIVGIGASAGGLAAFEAFFAEMPSDTGMAFVLVQHLAPEHKSILRDLVKQYTGMEVHQVEDEMVVEPNCIYIIPPNRNMAFRHGRLHLSERAEPRGVQLPIDFFFRSLAQAQGEWSICVVLSGAGTDGTLGLKAIKGEGGMAMVQDPDSAEYKSMPASAISTGLVDYVLPPGEMAARLIAYVQHAFGRQTLSVLPPAFQAATWLPKIFTLLQAQTGHDFSYYKQNTICRRIQRRLAVNQIEQLDDYIHYLEQNPLEVESLFRDFLIGVTNFFRDQEAFEFLKEQVIPRLFAGKVPGDSIRVWVPGCSTGEEAYSIAILLREYLEATKQHFEVRIFATDIDSQAIGQARTGIYPANIAANVSPERLSHFFTRVLDGNAIQINKVIRDMLVFAEQNLTEDPPFSRLDLISCRNLLIYIQGEMQKKVLHLFHYALNPEGFLFLGSSETTGEFMDLFATLDRKWKLYQSQGAVHHPPSLKYCTWPLTKQAANSRAHYGGEKESKTGIRELVEGVLLKQYAPACVVINRRGEILYVYGRTSKYLELPPGEARMNILQMAREGLKLELNNAISKVVTLKEPLHYQGLKVMGNGKPTLVNLTVNPVSEGSPVLQDLIMVIFQEVMSPAGEDLFHETAATVELTSDQDKRLMVLEQELQNKEEYLQTIIEELETSNEELQSTNEELQSTNEELETSKEELQSVNEELLTVNRELEKNIEELSQTNSDINNMLAGTGVGTVFLDIQLRIKRFTPIAAKVINLLPSDLERPVSHIASNLVGYDCLEEDVQAVMDTLLPKEKAVETREGLSYLMRILPYRTTKNAIEGAVITFIDVTGQMQMQNSIKRLAVIVRDSNEAITMLDLQGQILAWNPGAEKMYGWSESQALTMNIGDLVPEGQDKEALEMIKKLSQHEKIQPFQTQRLTKNGKTVEVGVTSSVLVNEAGEPYAVATIERCIN